LFEFWTLSTFGNLETTNDVHLLL